MPLLPKSLLWRTFFIIAFLLVVSVAAWTLTSKRLYKATAKMQMINSDDGGKITGVNNNFF